MDPFSASMLGLSAVDTASKLISPFFQKKFEERQFQRQLQLRDDDREYNSPANQAKLFREAGINPRFALTGQSFTPSISPDPPLLQTPQFDSSPIRQSLIGANTMSIQKDILQEELRGKKLNNDYLESVIPTRKDTEMQRLTNLRGQELSISLNNSISEVTNKLKNNELQRSNALLQTLPSEVKDRLNKYEFDSDYRIQQLLNASVSNAILTEKHKELKNQNSIFGLRVESQQLDNDSKRISNDILRQEVRIRKYNADTQQIKTFGDLMSLSIQNAKNALERVNFNNPSSLYGMLMTAAQTVVMNVSNGFVTRDLDGSLTTPYGRYQSDVNLEFETNKEAIEAFTNAILQSILNN